MFNFKRYPSWIRVLPLLCLLPSHGFAADQVLGDPNSRTVITWTGCGISKKGFMEELADKYGKEKHIKFVLSGGGATKGIRKVAEGSTSLGGSCRMPLAWKDKKTGQWYIESQEHNVVMIPVGWDALVAMTHPSNPVRDISTEQMKAIFDGKITSWKALGGPDKPINLYYRSGKISGVGLTLRQVLFQDPEKAFTKNAKVLASSGAIEKAIEGDPLGFAVSGISSARKRNLNMLSINGVEPTLEALRTGKYHYYRILYLAAPPDYAMDPNLLEFVKYVTSVDGQKLIRSVGTLPYIEGMHLNNSQIMTNYAATLEAIEQSGIYAPFGKAKEKLRNEEKNAAPYPYAGAEGSEEIELAKASR